MSRVLALAIGSIALIVASTLGLDWFVASLGSSDVNAITIDLREARGCTSEGPCAVVPLSMFKGAYPMLAAVTFWGALLFAVLVVYQAGSKVLAGFANESITKGGHLLGAILLMTTFGAGYLFGPEVGSGSAMGLGIAIERTWGPVAMFAGILVGNLALYYTRDATGDDIGEYKPIEIAPRAKTATTPPAVARAKTVTTPPVVARAKTATTPPAERPRAPTMPPPAASAPSPQPAARRSSLTTPPPMQQPDACKGRIQFAAATGEVTVAGIDARREAGGTVLVLWRDVVGLVVRRLPPELDGHVFLDIVSTAGMTLRILPWTRLTGEPLEGDAEGRVRALVESVRSRCPEATVDRATQSFLDGARPAAQLPSLEVLAKHDQALA